jgi:hypothetical protein
MEARTIGGHVQHQVELAALQRRLDGGLVAQVGDLRLDQAPHPGLVEQGGRLVGGERQAGDPCAERGQPDRRPRALEAGVAGEQDALARPEGGIGSAHFQTCQGALPEAQRASS